MGTVAYREDAAGYTHLFTESEIMIPQAVENIKGKDRRILKYFPDQMLSEEQKIWKQAAIEEQEEKRRKYVKTVDKFSFADAEIPEAASIESEAFKRWFGNSKVVNEDGSPKVMYHGTATEFWTFDKRKANDITGRRMGLGAGKGKFYLTEFEGSANAAAHSAQGRGNGKTPKVMALYVSAQKVMDRGEYERLLNEAYTKYPGSRPNESGYDYKQRDKAVASVDRKVRAQGYDAVWDRESGEMFVYEPEQIKSATDNVGTYDGKNPDIRYSLGSDFVPLEDRDKAYFDNIDQHADIQVVRGDATLKVPLDQYGGIDGVALIQHVKKNPMVEMIKGRLVCDCDDIGKKVEIDRAGITHFGTSRIGKNHRTINAKTEVDARVAMHVPELLQHAVEVNRSTKRSLSTRPYGHVLMAVYEEADATGVINQYAVRMIVEHNTSKATNDLLDYEVIGALHATKTKKTTGVYGRIGNHAALHAHASKISISDLIREVKPGSSANEDFGDTFSRGAYQKAGMVRKQSDLTPYLMYSLKDVDSYNPEMEVLLEENNELREVVKMLQRSLERG